MATIIIDYENVKDTGLKGIDSLCEEDKLAVFFSNTCSTISQECVDYIQESGCSFEVVQLKTPRANALDFYQAAYVGELVANGETEIALITKDKGFHSIKDYVSGKWSEVQVVVAPNVQIALTQFSSPLEAERRKKLQYKMNRVSIDAECRRINADKEYKRKIAQALEEGGFGNQVGNVYDFLKYAQDKGRKSVYTSALHTFGRQQGTRIYSLIRDVI